MAKHTQHRSTAAVLAIRDLHVYYGQSHALQGVDLTLEQGVHAVIGRNGMGKTTLCNAIMGLLPARRGSIRFHGTELIGAAPHKIAAMGLGYTPQGRRLWPSLSVQEHLLLAVKAGGAWSIDRIYDTFPRLAERRQNGAGQLSGGEQQMLSISRALLQDPELLILDEPTEGLAPVIVDQLEKLLAELAAQRDIAILLIEQNIALATAISDDIAIMVNGRIDRVIAAQELAGDRLLQEQLLGVGRHASDQNILPLNSDIEMGSAADVQLVDDTVNDEAESNNAIVVDEEKIYLPPTRWSNDSWAVQKARRKPDSTPLSAKTSKAFNDIIRPVYVIPSTELNSSGVGDIIYVAGTFDTKARELGYIRDQIAGQKLQVRTVDLSTSGKPSSADVPPTLIASYHAGGASTVFNGDRGTSITNMASAFTCWMKAQRRVAGIISAGGSGGTALATPAMRSLPVGIPKVMISTLASGDVSEYVGPADIMMMYSVTDVQGLNKISRKVLANGAHAVVGMVKAALSVSSDQNRFDAKPGLGLTMFGVTTAAVQQITSQLDSSYDCMVFHATGTGGRSMEKLVDSGMLAAAIDLTTTEICDMMMGGFFAADEDRFGAFIRSGVPYVGSVGALDMVNFLAPDTVPNHYRGRTFVEHNPQVTLMRTTADENSRMGKWIAERLNEMPGSVRFLLPEGGVSALDAPGQAFYDPDADKALFDAIGEQFETTSRRRLIRVPFHINDAAFSQAAIDALDDISPINRSLSSAFS